MSDENKTQKRKMDKNCKKEDSKRCICVAFSMVTMRILKLLLLNFKKLYITSISGSTASVDNVDLQVLNFQPLNEKIEIHGILLKYI